MYSIIYHIAVISSFLVGSCEMFSSFVNALLEAPKDSMAVSSVFFFLLITLPFAPLIASSCLCLSSSHCTTIVHASISSIEFGRFRSMVSGSRYTHRHPNTSIMAITTNGIQSFFSNFNLKISLIKS